MAIEQELEMGGMTKYIIVIMTMAIMASIVGSLVVSAEEPTLPETPVLASPDNGAYVPGNSVTFVWNASARATSYFLQVNTAQDWSGTNLILSEVGNVTQFTVDGFTDDGTTYYWKVWASNAVGISDYTARGFINQESSGRIPIDIIWD